MTHSEASPPEMPGSPVDSRPSPLGRVLRLARKELREILRDRRTIITLVAMPVLLYPLMSVVFLQFSLASNLTHQAPVYNIGFVTTAERDVFFRRFNAGWDALQRKRDPQADETKSKKPNLVSQTTPFPRPPADEKERNEQLEWLKDELRDKAVDLVVSMPGVDPDDTDVAKKELTADRYLPCHIYYLPNHGVGESALSQIETAFAALNEENLTVRLNKPGVTAFTTVLGVKREQLETPGQSGMITLAALVPLVLILMTITGAVYPAIDLTAGERERGTLEILIAAPVPRFELLAAKYISVVTVAVLNAVVNLVCMTLTILWSGATSLLLGTTELSPLLVLQVFLLLLLFAAFFSAVLLCLTSFARSFKEAQAYLIPLMLGSIGPGVMAMMPGLTLKGVLTVLPLVNIVLMARDLFDEGGVDPVKGAVVVFTTLLYALAALSLAARVFGAESVLYSEQSGWADLLRRPDMPQPVATVPSALWCLALMLPIQFTLFAFLQSMEAIPIAIHVLLGIVVNLLLFGMLPSLFLYLGRVNPDTGLGLRMPAIGSIFGAVLLGVSLWPLELWVLSQSSVSGSLSERFGAVVESFRAARESMGWWVLAMVVVPAVLEEFFFRGLLFNALRASAGALVTIAVSALLFGLTHVILGGALGLERLAPSLALGLILGAVCWRTGSLWPSLIQHVIHNSILLIVGLNETGTIPWTRLMGGAIGTMVGGILVWQWGARTNE